MFELTDLNVKKITQEESKLRRSEYGFVPSYGTADEYGSLYARPKFEEGEILTYFKSRRVSKSWVQWWIILQALTLFYQLMLYSEVADNGVLYDSVVDAHCNKVDAGSCKSRLWNTYFQADRPFDSSTNFETGFPVTFKSTTKTPLSVQVNVFTDPPSLHIPFELFLKRHSLGGLPERTFYEYRTTGLSSVIITENGPSPVGIVGLPFLSGVAQWEGHVKLGEYPGRYTYNGGGYTRHSADALMSHVRKELKSIRIVVNEVNSSEMSEYNKDVGEVCDFEKSWRSVMMQAMSQGSRRLVWIRNFLIISILASAVVTFLVWTWYGGRRTVDGLSFHYIVGLKCFMQDMPLQAIVLYYICSWYEGGGGERCQLCLLDSVHCQSMSPFHLSNFLLVALVLVSSVSNQFLFSADPAQLKTEDDSSFVIFFRYVLVCLSILPFSTAMVAFNGSLIQVPALLHFVFLIPCFTGWVALFSLICFPLTTLIEDEEYIY